MKFATYERGGLTSTGVVHGERVYPVKETMQELLNAGLARALDLGTDALDAPSKIFPALNCLQTGPGTSRADGGHFPADCE